jgi:hypothetical protein
MKKKKKKRKKLDWKPAVQDVDETGLAEKREVPAEDKSMERGDARTRAI